MAMPRVSAIIIVRDGEAFIAEAIESVMAQSDVDWELVVVDDGSRDNTESIVLSFVAADPDRVRLIHHPAHANRGMSASRNLGIEQSTGEYIAFLDADDLWVPGKLAEQVAILDAEPRTALVYGRTQIWHSWQANPRKADFFYRLGVASDVTHPPGVLFRLLLANTFQTPTTCNAMMRRTSVLAVGGFDRRFHNMFEDQILFAKLLLRFPAHVSSRYWARYRQHDASTTSSFHDPVLVDQAHVRYLIALLVHTLRTRQGSWANIGAIAKMAGPLLIAIARRRTRRAARRCIGLKGAASTLLRR